MSETDEPSAGPLINAVNLSLSFPSLTPADRKLLTDPLKFLIDFYLSRPARKNIEILNGLSFVVNPGDRLGILGHNGAGKSTLLRLLSGVYAPSSGHIQINGMAKGLFDVSSGMSLDATGLENVYLRGLQMGMTIAEIKSKIPSIMEFTELEDNIHRIFGTYSSGMRLRLAFAISTMIETDILLMDEWLGAGDARFKAKVKERMGGLVDQSRALVIASHSVTLLKQLCNKGLVLNQGQQLFFGSIDDAIELYNEQVKKK